MTNDPELIALAMSCPFCGSAVEFKSNAIIYGREFGPGFAYICSKFPECDSYVGCHGDKAYVEDRGIITNDLRWMPLGTLANKELREIRKSVHVMIDPYWQTKKISRGKLYRILARELNLDEQDTHIAMFDKATCQKILDHFYEWLPEHLRLAFLEKIK